MLSAVKTACTEVRQSAGFAELLELVLLTGNFMSASTKTHKSVYGFHIGNLNNVRINLFNINILLKTCTVIIDEIKGQRYDIVALDGTQVTRRKIGEDIRVYNYRLATYRGGE
jgi:hypothetical protein